MVSTGLDVFLRNAEKYKSRRIGLIANQTSVTRDFQYSWDALPAHGLRVQRLFSPEHGLFSTEQDQVSVAEQQGTPMDTISLYGDSYDSLIPDERCLEDIDLILFDIQDVGSRYYTYVNTMALFMKALDKKGIQMLILDRPNPLGGNVVEGPLLDEDYRSFVGVFPVPVRHGMTPGELALYYRDREAVDIDLSVVKMDGWHRRMFYGETGRDWVPPSPNMPTPTTALVYPGMCLLEGLNISEGRGTTTPFQVFGAPFIDPDALIAHIQTMDVHGVTFRPIYFRPTFHKYRDEAVGGAFLHITDASRYRPFHTAIALVTALHDLYPHRLQFPEDVYEFNTKHPAFDLLTGGSRIREMIQNGATVDEIAASWKDDEIAFAEIKQGYHLYGD